MVSRLIQFSRTTLKPVIYDHLEGQKFVGYPERLEIQLLSSSQSLPSPLAESICEIGRYPSGPKIIGSYAASDYYYQFAYERV